MFLNNLLKMKLNLMTMSFTPHKSFLMEDRRDGSLLKKEIFMIFKSVPFFILSLVLEGKKKVIKSEKVLELGYPIQEVAVNP